MPRIPGQTPPAPQPAAPEAKSQFSVPEAGLGGGTSRRPLIVLLSILAAALVLGGGYWYFFIRDTEEVVVETPTPTVTPTPTPVNVRLSDIFPSRAATIALPATGDALQAFLSSYKTSVTPSLGLFGQITVTDANATIALTPFQLLSRFLVNYPADINNLIGSDSVVLVYGQQEAFTSAGKIAQASTGAKRLVFITELTSPAYGTLQSWEPTMSNDLASLFAITPSKNVDPFLSTDYQGTSVRYKNFAFPDASIDYGILSYQGKSYLIMAGSREAMFAAIDAIRLFSQTVGS
ncbi:MAG TPA: hypothetical protein VG941_01425 [Candidatus Paceibacterota bacterium]|nr:hypothetical protein [Candidatus Paceibacterota bacterium]